jgi:hypothetical protein
VEALVVGEPLKFTQDANGLSIALPETKIGDYVYGFKIEGPGVA